MLKKLQFLKLAILTIVLSLLLVDLAGAQTTGSATIEVTPPTVREDGTALPLSEIDGYVFIYQNSNTGETKSINVADGSITSKTITGLALNDYVFQVVAWDTNGCEGLRSDVINLPINATHSPIGKVSFTVSSGVDARDRAAECEADATCTNE